MSRPKSPARNVTINTIARTMSNDKPYEQNSNILGLRQYGKYLSPELSATKPIVNGKRYDGDWLSTNKNYYQSEDQENNARKEVEEEAAMLNQKDGVWNITHVNNDEGVLTLCNVLTGACLVVALVAAKSAGYMGGKTRRNKSRRNKSRRHCKK